MKKSILIILIFCFSISYSQEKQTCKKKFSIGISASPSLSTFYIYNTDTILKPLVDKVKSTNSAKFSYSFGVNAKYRFNKTLGVELGVKYLNIGSKYNEDINIIGDNIPINIKAADNYYFIDIPIFFNVSLINKKFSLTINPGIGIDFYINNKIKTTYTYNNGSTKESNYEDKMSSYRKTNLSALLNIGFQYNISEHFTLSFNPFYQQFLYNTYLNNGTGHNLFWNSGLDVKFFYNF